MQVTVNATKGGMELAIRSFRRKTQKESVIKEARRRKAHEKPSEKKKRKEQENIARKIKNRIAANSSGSSS